MHRTKTKQITPEAIMLKRLREGRGLSMAQAAALASKSISWVSHVENGRVDVSNDHYRTLLPLYGQTLKSFQSYLSGAAFVASPTRTECLDFLQSMSDDLLEAIHPVLAKLASKKELRS